jgi:hypothetical protein
MADETTEAPGAERDLTWSENVEARLAALEDKAGLTKKADKADTDKEDK